jgi:erythronate-4-phosphate dehydrogenase
MIKIIADNKIPFLKGVLEPFASVVYMNGSEINRKSAKDADALIIRTRTFCNKELLEGTNVKLIVSATIGHDHIDTVFCEESRIKWANAPGCNSGSVMQYVASALIRLSMKYKFNFQNKTLGVIGHGNVGSKISRLAKDLGMNALVNDPPLQRKNREEYFVSLDEVLKYADIVSFHVPLNREGIDKTFHMADKRFLASLKPGAILINTSRGEVVDTSALKDFLKSRHLAACVLDVWENEPDIDMELIDLVDYATPHIAGYSVDGKANGTSMSVRVISRFFNFGLENWFPADVPLPRNIEPLIDCKGKSVIEIIGQFILETYDIEKDDQRFRNAPMLFEQQRGNYPLRREFGVYKPQLIHGTDELLRTFKKVFSP